MKMWSEFSREIGDEKFTGDKFIFNKIINHDKGYMYFNRTTEDAGGENNVMYWRISRQTAEKEFKVSNLEERL